MVKGLEEELKERLNGGRKYLANAMSPSPQYETAGGIDDGNWALSSSSSRSSSSGPNGASSNELPTLRQGPSVHGVVSLVKRLGKAVWKKRNKILRV
jgi:hypothetical protein